MPRKALGKGLDALISQREDEGNAIVMLPVDAIAPNPFQPRTNAYDPRLEELVESIREKGVLQPIIVTHRKEKYILVAGERRWRAAQKAGIHSIPALIKDCADDEMLLIALIENIQREDLNPVEEAQAYLKLIKDFHMTQEEVAKRVGKPRTTVTNMIRLLKLPEQILSFLSDDKISVGHAKVLLSLDQKNEQIEFAKRIIREGWSVRELERRIQEGKVKQAKKTQPFEHPDWKRIKRELERWMGAPVTLSARGKNRIALQIVFKTVDEFEEFYDRMKILFKEDKKR